MDGVLQARQLQVCRGPCAVLENVELTLPAGQVLGVLGANGAGKSSLLAALSGELEPAQGQVLLQGRPLHAWSARERALQLAVLPQSSTLNFAFSVEAVVAFGGLPHSEARQQTEQRVAAALQAADAVHLRGRNYLELSGGERQRVHLARVLAQLWPGQPGQVLLLDEPTAMLDPAHQHGILQAVRQLAGRGVAVLVVLHDLNLAARYCDHLLLLHQRHVHAQGSPAQVLEAGLLEQVFGLPVLVQRHPLLDHPLVLIR